MRYDTVEKRVKDLKLEIKYSFMCAAYAADG